MRNRRVSHWALAFILSVSLLAPASRAELPPLIPREILFGNPEKVSPELSPDGKWLAWRAPDSKNVLQVWLEKVGEKNPRAVTRDKKRGIRSYTWAYDNRTLLYLQDVDGDENWHIYGADLSSGNVRDYTPFEGVHAQLTATDPQFPDEILVSLNLRDGKVHDVYRVNLATGALVLDTQNPGDVQSFFADPQLQIRAAQINTREGGTEIRIRESVKTPWRSWIKVGPEEVLQFRDFSGDGKWATLNSSLGSDTARVVQKEIATGKEKVLASSPEVDAAREMINPKTHAVEAVAFAPERLHWKVLDPAVKDDFAALGKIADGELSVVSRDLADEKWLVSYNRDRGSVRYYEWDRPSRTTRFLFAAQPKLENLSLAEMKPISIKSRDGLTLHGYLTLPVGVPAKNLPVVLLVHGGPWGRDSWGYNPTAQWLANRGYATLQVNFRASTGYGKKFLDSGNRQWGLKMHDDLIDSVDWLIRQGVADPKKVAIYGGSYGGYAALAGVTFTPQKFACAVDIVGPSNLRTLLSSIPPYWESLRHVFNLRMGNIDDPKDAELIKNASPLFKAAQIVRPLLIGQGANDPRVNKAESEQIVAAIEAKGGQAIYVLYPDEGHGFARPENRIDFTARAEEFLAKHLGGRFEPLNGERYPGSTAVVRVIGEKSALIVH